MRHLFPRACASALIVSIAALAGGCKPASPDDAPSDATAASIDGASDAAASQGKLATLLVPSMLGEPVTRFEQIAGAPAHAGPDGNRYDVEGCTITAGTTNGVVASLRVDMAEGCRFDLAPILSTAQPAPVSGTETFAPILALADGMGMFKTDCLSMCGNAFEPNTVLMVGGSQATGFVDVEIGAKPGPAQNEANARWEEHMRLQAGDDYVQGTRFNCSTAHDAIARSAFAAVQVGYVRFGEALDHYTCD